MAGEIGGGYEYTLYYVEETVPGTTQASPAFIELGVVNSANLKYNTEILQHTGIGNKTPVATSKGKNSGDISVKMENTDVAAVLALLILSAAEKHFTFVAKKSTTQYFYTLGSSIGKAKFAGSPSDPIVSIELEVMGMQALEAQTDPFTTPDYATNAWTPVAPALFNVTSITKSGAWTDDDTLADASSWEFEIDYGVEKRNHLDGNKFPRRVQRKGYLVKGKYTQDFENTKELKAQLLEEEGILAIPIDSSNTATLSGVTYDSMEVPIEELVLIEFEVPFEARTIAF